MRNFSPGAKFSHDVLRPVDAILLFQFSTCVSQAPPFTDDSRRIADALNHLRTGPATALYHAILLTAQARQSSPRELSVRHRSGYYTSKIDWEIE